MSLTPRRAAAPAALLGPHMPWREGGGADENGEARALLQHWGLFGQGQQAWLTSLLVSRPPAGEGGARNWGVHKAWP